MSGMRSLTALRASVAVLVLATCAVEIPSRADELSDQLQIISESYLANRARFKNGKCRFRYSTRSARSEELALKEQWSDDLPHLTSEVKWYFREDDQVLKMDIDNDDVAMRLENQLGVLTPVNIMMKGGFSLDSDGIATNAIVSAPGGPPLRIPYHPFNLAIDSNHIDPASQIASLQSDRPGQISFQVDPRGQYDGIGYLMLKQVAGKVGRTSRHIWYLRPDKGYLPYVTEFTESTSDELVARMFIVDIAEVEGGFFPMHSMYLAPMKTLAGNDIVRVRELKVLEFEPDVIPTDEELTITLSKNTQFSDGTNPKTAKTLYRDSKSPVVEIPTSRLRSIYEELQGIAIERRESAQLAASQRSLEKATSNKKSFAWPWLIILNAILVVAACVLLIWRRRTTV